MLENIKSIDFIKLLFSYTYEGKKLKLIKHNKNIQKKVNANINNYKLFKRKYVTYDKDGLAREYDLYDNELRYKGEYLNGERNGKGKEYYGNCPMLFEGEFKHGKKWNGNGLINGKGYIKKQSFIKTYKIGQSNTFGQSNVFNQSNNFSINLPPPYIVENFIFEGEYVNGERNGKGKEYNFGQLIFEGEYLNGKKYNGWGYDDKGNKIYELKCGKG